MFARSTLLFTLALLLVGQVLSLTIKRSNDPAIIERSAEVLDTMLVSERDEIPAEVAVKAPTGTIEVYGKRQVPEEEVVNASLGQTELFARQIIPAEIAVTALDGKIRPY
ncbi:hypothetical protein AX17_000795 [Amanita inopinata Kibby_2008]|nr:hypothetical protein AX17_000795 [Amanita inopinata Kibby_2008]